MKWWQEFRSNPLARRTVDWSIIAGLTLAGLGACALKGSHIRKDSWVGASLIATAMLIVALAFVLALIFWLTSRETEGIKRLSVIVYPAITLAALAYVLTVRHRFPADYALTLTAWLAAIIAYLPAVGIARRASALARWIRDGFADPA